MRKGRLQHKNRLGEVGLGNLSTDLSKNRVSVMGLHVTKAMKAYLDGTPVQISIDVARKKKKWRLDGIIKIVIGLLCNRYCPREFTLPTNMSGVFIALLTISSFYCFILFLIMITIVLMLVYVQNCLYVTPSNIA